MSFIRKNEIDVAANRDTTGQAVVELYEDTNDIYTALNLIESDIELREDSTQLGVADGVCDLNESNLVDIEKIPTIPISLLAVNPYAPVGSLLVWPFNNIPSKYLECDGSLVSASYTSLIAVFNAYANPYGQSGGRPYLPDYRGYLLRVNDSGAGVDPHASYRYARGDGMAGDYVGTIQGGDIQNHYHYTIVWGWKSDSPASFYVLDPGAGDGYQRTWYTAAHGGPEMRPVNKTVKVLIKYE